MKWYSVNKYSPLWGVVYFVTGGNIIYTAEYTIDGWINVDEEFLLNITHFCIPDPVEIEE